MSTSLYILDDDLYFGRCLKKALETTMDHVKHFKTERNFLKALNSPPNIIVLDYHLEHSTGLEVITQMKQEGVESEFILVSDQKDAKVVMKAYKSGALGYFEKRPETFKEVQRCIQWMLLMSNDFNYPLKREEFRRMWLKRDR